MSAPDFDRMYSEERDPWKVATSWYEQRKIAIVVAALSSAAYDRALDPACGTAHLALAIAQRCGEVVASDASPAAIEVARETCAGSDRIRLSTASVPYDETGPAGPFDLIVLSEFLYYLGDLDRSFVIESVLERAAGRVELVTVHWREQPEDGTISGDGVHEELREVLKGKGFRHQVAHFDEEFVLDIFTRGHDVHSD